MQFIHIAWPHVVNTPTFILHYEMLIIIVIFLFSEAFLLRFRRTRSSKFSHRRDTGSSRWSACRLARAWTSRRRAASTWDRACPRGTAYSSAAASVEPSLTESTNSFDKNKHEFTVKDEKKKNNQLTTQYAVTGRCSLMSWYFRFSFASRSTGFNCSPNRQWQSERAL